MPGRANPKPEVSPLYGAIGRGIRAARDEAGLSQHDLAQAVRISRTSITNLENGNQQVPLHTLYEIAEALKINVHSLLPEVAPKLDTPTYGDEDVSRWSAQLQTRTSRRVSA